ncbi:hypothetical protein [Streptomyces sp. Caat 7-52]|uniref:pyroglutamyl-peptidase I family protein n=1 Tax=Streptomyces sp. Caat 7-52 TaxID=2949637 RepID=UPI002034E7C4|nr:hypothetical protein [Streptomyces sp. Caat 7-52]
MTFDQDTYNPSWAVAQLLQENPPDGVRVTAVQLSCVFGKSLSALRDAVLEADPELVVSIGLSPRTGISVERFAINVDDSPVPDNAGRQPIDEPIASDGPAAYFSTLPIKRIVSEVRKKTDVNAWVSQTDGTFVCNHARKTGTRSARPRLEIVARSAAAPRGILVCAGERWPPPRRGGHRTSVHAGGIDSAPAM